jgi:hypothetical protein
MSQTRNGGKKNYGLMIVALVIAAVVALVPVAALWYAGVLALRDAMRGDGTATQRVLDAVPLTDARQYGRASRTAMSAQKYGDGPS